jgi:hypothetical protein
MSEQRAKNAIGDKMAVPDVVRRKVLVLNPSFYPLEAQEAGLYAIDEIVEAISRVVRPVHDLALQTPVVEGNKL